MFATWFRILIASVIGGGLVGGLLGLIIGGLVGMPAAGPYIEVFAYIVGMGMSYVAFRYFVKELFIEILESSERSDAV